MSKSLRGYFITGLLVVVPLYLTIYVLSIIARFMDNIFKILPEALWPDRYLGFHVPGLGIIFTVLGVFIVGVLTTNFLGKKLIGLTEMIMSRLPVVRSVYNATKQLLETFFTGEQESFRKVVLIEFPKAGVYSVGFVTGKVKGEIREKTEETSLNIFLPCTPNPTTGYYIVASEKDVIPLDMKVEDAFKVIMTGGLVVPGADGLKAVHKDRMDKPKDIIGRT